MPKQKWVELFQDAEKGKPASCGDGISEGLDQELANCRFRDRRLGRRFRKLVGPLASRLGQTIPLACQDGANTKYSLSEIR